MKTITKEYNVLEVSDIEKAVSDFLGKPTKISEIYCELKSSSKTFFYLGLVHTLSDL